MLYFLPPSSGSSENSTPNNLIYTLSDISPACRLVLSVLQSNTEGLHELACGGLIYCLGVFFFKSDGIIPFAHAIWHVFVALAAAVHYYAIWKYLYKAPSADTLLQSWPQPGLDAGSPPSSSSSCAPERRCPAHRLPQLPAEAATTAKKFTKTLTVNCLLFSNEGEQIFFWPTKATFKKLFCTTSVREGV